MTITLRLHSVWLRAIATGAAGSNRLVRAVPGPLCALASAGCSGFGPDRPDLSISLTSDVSLAAGHVFRVEVSGKR